MLSSDESIGPLSERDTDQTDLAQLHGFDEGDDHATHIGPPSLGHLELEAGPAGDEADDYSEISIDVQDAGPIGHGQKGDGQSRLTPTLLKIFARRRAEINLSLEQLARISGISLANLQAFEDAKAGQTITYDQAVVLAKALGISPDELPGLRRKDTRAHLGVTLSELERTLLGAPILRFEGANGERYGGDVDRVAASKAFTVRIEDDSLSPTFTRGAILGFMAGVRPRQGAMLLLRHRRSALLAMRRHVPPAYAGICSWQPSYVVGGEWHLIGSLEVVLPPR